MDFDEKQTDAITAMNSSIGEKVAFEKSVVCTGGVEFWLNNLLATVRDTVKGVIAAQAQCFVDPDYDFIVGFVAFCGQVITNGIDVSLKMLACFFQNFQIQAGLVGIQTLWTKEAEVAIRRARADKLIMKLTNQRFLDLLNSLIDLTSKDLTKMQRTHYETMVTIHVHQRQEWESD